MQSISDKFKSIYATGKYTVETKLLIDGVTYDESRIMSLSISNGVFASNTPSVGGCVSGEIDMVIVEPVGEIPRMAKLEPYIRLRYRNEVSEWIRKGIYYIDTRSTDSSTGMITIHGYDAMMKAEKLFDTDTLVNWGSTKSDKATVTLIRAAMDNIALDSRTVLNKSYKVPRPASGDGAENMRTVLGYIAAAYGGNWVITYDGKLLLVPLGGIPEETYYLCDEVGNFITFGGERIEL